MDREIPSMWEGEFTIRIYHPVIESYSADELLPALVYAHGGGWVFGNLNTHDGLCRCALARLVSALCVCVCVCV
jgi:acetyl esterase